MTAADIIDSCARAGAVLRLDGGRLAPIPKRDYQRIPLDVRDGLRVQRKAVKALLASGYVARPATITPARNVTPSAPRAAAVAPAARPVEPAVHAWPGRRVTSEDVDAMLHGLADDDRLRRAAPMEQYRAARRWLQQRDGMACGEVRRM